jgi:competence protein ComEC
LIALAWIAGLVLAHSWPLVTEVDPVSLLVLSLIPLGWTVLWRDDRGMRLSGFCALALLTSVYRYQLQIPDVQDPSFVAHYNEQGWVTLEGIVRSYPDVRDTRTLLRLDAETLTLQQQQHPVQGTVLVQAPRYPEYGYGDRLQVSGLLETPPELEGFSYRAYLSRQGIYSILYHPHIERLGSDQGSPLWSTLYAVKDRARDVIGALLPEPEASLLQGILLGIQSGIPDDLYDAYNTTGTSHVIIISGSNVTIVSALLLMLLGRVVGRRRAYWFTIAGIVVYVLFVGADAAVTRAGLMGALLVTAMHLGRRSTAYVSLFASALFLTALNPLTLWDVGFQLSFAATLSIILFSQPIQGLAQRGIATMLPNIPGQDGMGLLADGLAVTLAAMILTVPLVVFYFGRLSLVAPVANLLILPVQPPIMTLGGVAAMLGLVPILQPVAQVVAWFPWLALAYTNTIVRWTANWPLSAIEISGSRTPCLVVPYSIVLFVIALRWLRRRRSRQTSTWLASTVRNPSATAVLVLAVSALLSWLAVLQLPDGKLHIAFLDVGQGDAALVTTPHGQQILVDGGPSPIALAAALGQEMPFWDRSIDMIVMSHADADHITGLAAALDRYRVRSWLDNGRSDDDPVYAQCLSSLEQGDVNHYCAQGGDLIELGDGLVIEILSPPREKRFGTASDANSDSLVARVVWGDARFLFTGDITAETEQYLLESGQRLSSDVLKVAHHGSNGSTTSQFLRAVDPAYAVISVGADNQFGHPADAVLERIGEVGQIEIYRTDTQGTIEFITDGQRIWVESEK